jgi:arylsulfatase A-like enzyme
MTRAARLFAIVAAAGLAASTACREPRGVRVVLVTLDTLRYDAMRGAPDRPSRMPRTLGRADRGLLFDAFYASTSSTQPSHATLFTGLHPWQHGVTRNGQVLHDDYTTVAEVFRGAGYGTHAVVGSFPVSRRFGFAQGFDEFSDEFDEGDVPRVWDGSHDPEERYRRSGARVTDVALAQIERAREPKQFFWFHYFDAHSPYGDTGPGPVERPWAVLEAARAGADVREAVARCHDAYDRDVTFLDGLLERLLARLDRDAARFETHVVLVADHGESFGEDGSLAHGRRLTPGQIHVPLVVLSPRVTPAVRRDVAGSIDIPATLFSLARLPQKAAGGRDLTLAPAGPTVAVGMRRTFEKPNPDFRLDGRVHLLDFDLFYAVGGDAVLYTGNGAGLREMADTTHVRSDAGERLKALFGSFEARLKEARHAPEPREPEVQEALKALGYVD